MVLPIERTCVSLTRSSMLRWPSPSSKVESLKALFVPGIPKQLWHKKTCYACRLARDLICTISTILPATMLTSWKSNVPKMMYECSFTPLAMDSSSSVKYFPLCFLLACHCSRVQWLLKTPWRVDVLKTSGVLSFSLPSLSFLWWRPLGTKKCQVLIEIQRSSRDKRWENEYWKKLRWRSWRRGSMILEGCWIGRKGIL